MHENTTGPPRASAGRANAQILGPRILATLMAGLLSAAGSLVGVWVYSGAMFLAFRPPFQRFRVRDNDVVIALLAATAIWFVISRRIWRGYRMPRGFPVHRVLSSLGVVIGTALLMPVIDLAVVNEEEILMTAFGLVAGAVILLIWIPYVRGASTRAQITDSDGVVQISCPDCGYSMVGLREARCPECGSAFTLDELILSQPFAKSALAPPVAGPMTGR